jgi:N-acetylneuraminic acid mutarotase
MSEQVEEVGVRGGGDAAPGPKRRRGWRALVLVVVSGLGVVVLLLVATGVVLSLTNPSPRAASAWSTAASLPDARGEGSGAVVETGQGPRLAVVGGLSGLGRTNDEVTLYDPDDDAWTTLTPLPDPRHHTAATAIGGVLYVSGGSPSTTDLTTATADLWALDVEAGGDWEELAPLPQPRWGHRMVALDGLLYAVGGQPGPEVQIYDPEEGSWSLGAPLPEGRDHLGVVVLDGEIWVLGGRDQLDDLTARVDVYDPGADEWRDGPALPAPVSAAAVGVVEGRIHVVDGEDPATFGGGVLDAHWVLEPGDDEWSQGPASRLPVHGAADGVIDGRLYVAGGASRQGALSAVSWTDEVQVLEPGADA